MRDAGFGFMVTVGLLGFVLLTGGLLGGPLEAAAAGGEADFVGLPPCRLVDTRGNGFTGAFGPPDQQHPFGNRIGRRFMGFIQYEL